MSTSQTVLCVFVASGKELLRGSHNEDKRFAWNESNIKDATRQAIDKIKELGEGAAFRIEKSYNGNRDSIKCGVIENGRYMPRNNF